MRYLLSIYQGISEFVSICSFGRTDRLPLVNVSTCDEMSFMGLAYYLGLSAVLVGDFRDIGAYVAIVVCT